MKRINALFKKLKREKKKAFLVYITCGDPNLNATKRIVRTLEKSGVDLIELGIPFSDPLADGPTIQKASERAISAGSNVKAAISLVRSVRKDVKLPIVFMTYYNLLLHYGIGKFIRDSKRAGADGVIIPDLPPEEAGEFSRLSRKNDFATILLVAPTSTEERLRRIASGTRGFIYYVSLTGVTGAREKLPADIIKNVKKLKALTGKPVCVGFGVGTPGQARMVSRVADGVIVGSAVVKVIEKNIGKKDLLNKVMKFVSGIARAVHGR